LPLTVGRSCLAIRHAPLHLQSGQYLVHGPVELALAEDGTTPAFLALLGLLGLLGVDHQIPSGVLVMVSERAAHVASGIATMASSTYRIFMAIPFVCAPIWALHPMGLRVSAGLLPYRRT